MNAKQFSHPAASRDELHIRKMKLDYQEVCQCSKDLQALWDRKLSSPCRTKVQWDKEEINSAVCQGKNCLLQRFWSLACYSISSFVVTLVPEILKLAFKSLGVSKTFF